MWSVALNKTAWPLENSSPPPSATFGFQLQWVRWTGTNCLLSAARACLFRTTFPQIKGALSMQETATGLCLPVAWRKQAIGSHLPRSFSRAEAALYSIIVHSFNVTFLGESVVICLICFIRVTVLMLTSARCPHRCVREQCSLVPSRRCVLWRSKSLHSWLISADSHWTSAFKGHIFMGSPGMNQESMP